jgi:ABC-type cobalt transport system substrate-binding protein
MVTELSLSEVSERMVPSVFHHPGRDPRDSEDPAVFKACFFDPAFGEIDSLLRAVFYNLEYGWCGPEQLDGIMRNVLGVESPRHLDMMDRRRTYEALMDGIPKRSQTPEVDYLVSTLMRAGVKRQEWQRCQVVSYDFDELHLSRRYELSAQDPGDGTISAFSFSPEHDVERATVSVWHGRENAVVVDDGDGSLYLESDPSVACGTVTYENPGRSIDVVFPDPVPSDETAWFYHEYFDSGTDLTDPEVHTRHEYLGDRSERIPGARRSSPVAATLYVYFRLDAGEEYYSGADEMSEECFSKAHSDYALRVALERVLPAFGVTEITYVDRIVVEAPLDEYAVNLPLEEGPADMMP